MVTKGRSITTSVLLLAIFILASIAIPAVAQSPEKSIKDRLVGHWQLVSVTTSGTEPYGPNPQGSMFLDMDGHYSVIVISAGNAKSISYFGTYTVGDADNSMTLHIDGSSRANADGRNQKRIITFSGDELIQDTPPSAGPKGTVKVTWKRSQ